MIKLIKKTKENGIFFITGDVHYSELSKLNTYFYPIYDFTSSGLSMDWNGESTSIKMATWDINNNKRFEYTVNLKEL